MTISRRSLIRNTAIAGAGLALLPGMVIAASKPASKLRLGFIGLERRHTLVREIHRKQWRAAGFPRFHPCKMDQASAP